MGPIRPKSSDLTRGQRLEILALRKADKTYDQIASLLNYTRRQVVPVKLVILHLQNALADRVLYL